jgi:GGDEF domain-containing protein
MRAASIGTIGNSVCLAMANAAGADQAPPGTARTLQAEMLKLRGTQVPAALAKGEAALAAAPDPVLALSLLADVAWLQLQNGNVPLALKTVERGLALARKQGDLASLRTFRIMQASMGMNMGSPATTRTLAMAVLKEAQAAGDTQNTIDAMRAVSQAEMASGNFIPSLAYLHQALELAEKAHNTASRQTLLFMLANFYVHTQDWPKALAANEQSFALAGGLDDQYRQATLLLNKSIIYSGMHEPDLELDALRQAQKLAQATGNHHVLLAAEVNLSDTLFHRKDYQGALEAADRGLAIARAMGMKARSAVAMVNKGMALNRLGRHAEGLAVMDDGVRQMQSAGTTVAAAEATGALADEYAFAGDYRNALKYQKAFKERSDQLHADERSKQLQELEARYRSEKQEKTIIALTAENDRRALVRNFSVIAGLLGVALAAAILARYRLLRRSAVELKGLNEKLLSQALTDPVTGLHNRRFFLENIGQHIAWTDRIHHPQDVSFIPDFNKDLVFFLIDVGPCKDVDGLMQTVACLRGVIRESDELVRWGEEQFMLVAKQTSRQQAPLMAQRLCDAAPGASCGIGFAAYPLLVGAPLQPTWQATVDLAAQALALVAGRKAWAGLLGKEVGADDELIADVPADLHTLLNQLDCQLVCSNDKTYLPHTSTSV